MYIKFMHGNSLLAVTLCLMPTVSCKIHEFDVHVVIDLGMQLREVAWFRHLNAIQVFLHVLVLIYCGYFVVANLHWHS